MFRYTIDRFEGAQWAVLEDEHAQTIRVPRQWVPGDAREGDVLTATEEVNPSASAVQFEIDALTREHRLNDARQRRADLPRGLKGDISL